jgi:Uma2 family endonuclease
VPGLVHEIVVIWLARLLGNWLGDRGWIVGSDASTKSIRPRSQARHRGLSRTAKLPRQGIVTVPPDIAVEVVSPTPRDERRDRIEKMDEYAAFESVYWIVDPLLQSLEVFELTDGRYARAARATEESAGRSGLCGAGSISTLWDKISKLDA